MSRSCFAPGCDTGYPKAEARNRALGQKNPSLFGAPKDATLLRKWQIAIPRKDRVFCHRSRLCELHFDEECFIRKDIIKLADGSNFVSLRERPKLRPGSVPTIFPNCPAYFSRNSRVFQRNRKRAINEKVENLEAPSTRKHADISVENPGDLQTQNEQHTVSIVDNIPESVPTTFQDCVVYFSGKTYSSRSNIKQTIKVENTEVSYTEKVSDIFVEDLRDLQKPNDQWTVSRNNNCIICFKLNADFLYERHIVVKKDYSTKVFLRNKEIKFSYVCNVASIKSLSNLLEKVDKLVICNNLVS